MKSAVRIGDKNHNISYLNNWRPSRHHNPSLTLLHLPAQIKKEEKGRDGGGKIK